MRQPKFLVVTKDGKAIAYYAEQMLIDAFTAKEFSGDDDIFVVTEKISLQATAVIKRPQKAKDKEEA